MIIENKVNSIYNYEQAMYIQDYFFFFLDDFAFLLKSSAS